MEITNEEITGVPTSAGYSIFVPASEHKVKELPDLLVSISARGVSVEPADMERLERDPTPFQTLFDREFILDKVVSIQLTAPHVDGVYVCSSWSRNRHGATDALALPKGRLALNAIECSFSPENVIEGTELLIKNGCRDTFYTQAGVLVAAGKLGWGQGDVYQSF